jgi:hypothetical protein
MCSDTLRQVEHTTAERIRVNPIRATARLLERLCEADKPHERRRVSVTGRGQLLQH